jgi:hypothetical protein
VAEAVARSVLGLDAPTTPRAVGPSIVQAI